jgi:Holliday junction resolvase RusA-like endonuclease
MAVLVVTWQGKAVSVNRWKDARGIQRRDGKIVAAVYERAEFRKFKADLAASLPPLNLDGYFDLKLEVCLWKGADTGNYLKAPQDALTMAGTIRDDRYIRNVYLERTYHKRGEPDVITYRLYRADGPG